MRLRRLSVQNFRNLAFAELALEGDRQFLLGDNAQGKTSLLEAAGLLTALRSFRTADARALIAHGAAEAAVAADLEHERTGPTRVVIRIRPGGKRVEVDGEAITRLGDFLGRFPTVVFSSLDLQLVRGAPAGRRRWLDLTLAAPDPEYLGRLQDYHRALAGRNALLRREAGGAELEAFERPLAAAGTWLQERRAIAAVELGAYLTEAYRRIAPETGAERVELAYLPACPGLDEAGLRERLTAGRARDQALRATMTGPHRDDFEFRVDGRPAKDEASEGQQRCLVLALRAAQAALFHRRDGVAPVVLADDVLGELDPGRRRRFWAAVEPGWQVLATGTTPAPAEGGRWQVFSVASGRVGPADSAGT
jgi:DNA replication and repair protein RecF